MRKLILFMVVNYTPSDESLGITKKIKAEIDAFTKKGFSVFYSCYGKNYIEIIENHSNKIVYRRSYNLGNGKLKSWTRRFDLLKACELFLKMKNFNVDVVFMRYLGFDILYLKVLQICKQKHAHVIVDMLGYFQKLKTKNIKGLYMNTCTKIFYKKALAYIDTLLTEGETNMFGKETIKAKMGIKIDNYLEHSYKGLKNEINMISVANETIYHGYDRLVKSIANYVQNNNNPIIKLHLVGVISEEVKKLITTNHLEHYVILYGKQYGENLQNIYDECNLAVGPLGQHRIGGKKDTGLKTKEYFGVGIPYFYAGLDSTVPNNYPYVLEIPSNEDLIDFTEIIKFYNSYKNNTNVAKEMRKFAIENYSWDKIVDEFLVNYNAEREMK